MDCNCRLHRFTDTIIMEPDPEKTTVAYEVGEEK